MLQPLIVGLGRSGAGLHLKVLARANSTPDGPFFSGPLIACDPRPEAGRGLRGVTVTSSITEAARLVSPPSTVVHVCTPPSSRAPVLTELARLGFTQLLVEKPLATDRRQLDDIVRLTRRHGLRLLVVSHWLDSDLTRRLRLLVRERPLGGLVSISVTQDKPRFLRSLTTDGHPTAFDVEVPHSLGVVLDLAGPARLLDARWTDLRCGDTVRPRMGGAWLALRHDSGVRTEISSDLTSPVQQRSLTLHFEHGRATGHYPLSEHDDHTQLLVSGARPRHGSGERQVFRDDALTAFIRRAYRLFAAGRGTELSLPCDVVRLLCEAKDHCRARDDRDTADGPPVEDAHAK
ncbi:Gfo/Idh/MocA family oxidoreductase [Streptomyces sp. HMX87]|uniref:Gfo/Idh/MocA family oxidoreductase n=1 Tax=Streptomyces sp. HMX87 TaxID=3390849 RepID=UPI003A8C1D20